MHLGCSCRIEMCPRVSYFFFEFRIGLFSSDDYGSGEATLCPLLLRVDFA